jgi:hypothetical protein
LSNKAAAFIRRRCSEMKSRFVLWEIPCKIRQHTLKNVHFILQ